jgi:TatA/E family protein of Tat protein translocase
MGTLGFPEIVVIVIIALVVFGPKKLPELSRTIGKALAEFRKASGELRSAMENEMREPERHTSELDRKSQQALPSGISEGNSERETAEVYDPDMDTRSIGFATGSTPKYDTSPAAPDSSGTEVKPPDGESKPA